MRIEMVIMKMVRTDMMRMKTTRMKMSMIECLKARWAGLFAHTRTEPQVAHIKKPKARSNALAVNWVASAWVSLTLANASRINSDVSLKMAASDMSTSLTVLTLITLFYKALSRHLSSIIRTRPPGCELISFALSKNVEHYTPR